MTVFFLKVTIVHNLFLRKEKPGNLAHFPTIVVLRVNPVNRIPVPRHLNRSAELHGKVNSLIRRSFPVDVENDRFQNLTARWVPDLPDYVPGHEPHLSTVDDDVRRVRELQVVLDLEVLDLRFVPQGVVLEHAVHSGGEFGVCYVKFEKEDFPVD